MPFKSKSQMAMAFSGVMGEEMKKKAPQWADETPNIKGLPKHVKTAAQRQAMLDALEEGGGAARRKREQRMAKKHKKEKA